MVANLPVEALRRASRVAHFVEARAVIIFGPVEVLHARQVNLVVVGPVIRLREAVQRLRRVLPVADDFLGALDGTNRALVRVRGRWEVDVLGLLGVENDVALEERHEFELPLVGVNERLRAFLDRLILGLNFVCAPKDDGKAVAAFLHAAAEFLNLPEGEEIRRLVARHGQHEKVHAAVSAVRGEVLRRVEVRAPGLPPRAGPALHQVENPFGDAIIGVVVCHIGSWSAQPKWPHASTNQYASRGSDFRKKLKFSVSGL